jgi:hypothetical protein
MGAGAGAGVAAGATCLGSELQAVSITTTGIAVRRAMTDVFFIYITYLDRSSQLLNVRRCCRYLITSITHTKSSVYTPLNISDLPILFDQHREEVVLRYAHEIVQVRFNPAANAEPAFLAGMESTAFDTLRIDGIRSTAEKASRFLVNGAVRRYLISRVRKPGAFIERRLPLKRR